MDSDEKRRSAYSSRLSRAKAFNNERRGITSPPGSGTSSRAQDSMANMAFSIPMQAEFDREQVDLRSIGGSTVDTPSSSISTLISPAASLTTPKQPERPAAKKLSTDCTEFVKAEEGVHTAAHWQWNTSQELMAVAEHTQLLKIIDRTGKTIYRVQLPQEGRTIFLGWEPSGAALAAVQDHGGAFLWFPSKPDCVQQWEGMQFSSQMLRSSSIKRNAHFDTCFASWSESRKLVLGLADGNFACWDLSSNETFISRKHFAGKHKGAITCGAWGARGSILALGSKNQIKVSKPLMNASWESTAAKLALPDNELSFQDLAFSPSGQTLSALAGTSIFRHLCLYAVQEQLMDFRPSSSRSASSFFSGSSGGAASSFEPRAVLMPVGEMRPNATIGGIQSIMWLDNEMCVAVTSNGYLRLLQYSPGDGALLEDQHRPCGPGVTSACLLKTTGHIAIVSAGLVSFFDPLKLEVVATAQIPQCPDGVRNAKVQPCTSGTKLFIGRTDGTILKVDIPKDFEKIDLSLLTIRGNGGGASLAFDQDSKGDGGASASGNGNGGLSATGGLCASCGQPLKVLSATAADGATSGFGSHLHHAWSQMRGLMAIVNGRNELIVMQKGEDGEAPRTLLRENLPETPVQAVSWDPSTQSVLAIALRHFGVALWDTKSDAGVQMWSGMAYKTGIPLLSKSTKRFDPVIVEWNLAGQLVAGMSDGTFAVWDSMSLEISSSGRSGKHASAITAASWFSSLFAPALAMASKNTIKISQGFEGTEWGATAMKLKLGKDQRGGGDGGGDGYYGNGFGSGGPSASLNRSASSRLRSISITAAETAGKAAGKALEKARSSAKLSSSSKLKYDPEALEFARLAFSPSGKYLAALASPTGMPQQKQLTIYELQDSRHSLVPSRSLSFNDGETVLGLEWLVDNSLLVFVASIDGEARVHSVAPASALGPASWPPVGTRLPGALVGAAASAQGLIALAFGTEEGKGKLVILTCPGMKIACELPLDGRPQSIQLYQPKGSYIAYLSIAFEGGGVEAWELPPKEGPVSIA